MSDYQAQDRFLVSATELAEAIHTSVNRMRAVKTQVESFMKNTREHDRGEDIETAGKELVEKITEWESELIQPKTSGTQDIINYENQLNAQVLALYGSVNGAEPPVTKGAEQRLRDLQSEWSTHKAALDELMTQVAAFNTLIKESNIDPVVIPKK
jgi:hypothetical protein